MNLASNIFPIEISFEQFNIQRAPWEDGKLEKLRGEYNQQYSFFKKDDYIYISPGDDNLPSLGELVTLKVDEEPLIVTSLIRHIFFRAFKNRYPQIKPTFNPFTFSSSKGEHNLILDELPEQLKSTISYKKLNEIDFKCSEVNGRKNFLLIIDSSYKWALRQTCKRLQEQGFDISTLEVARLVKHENSQEVVAPTFQAIGRVIRVHQDNVTVDTNDGERVYALSELYLNKTHDNIKLYLEFVLDSAKAESILINVKQKEFSRNDPTILYKEISQLSRVFSELEYKNGDGFFFQINKTCTTAFPKLQLDNPKYLFDISFTKTDISPVKGLAQFGPYDYGKFFEVSHPKVLVVCHKSSSGAFTQFLGRLKDGFNEAANFTQGMLKLYRLHAMDFHFVEVDSYNIDSFMSAIRKAVEFSDKDFDIAVIETREEFKRMFHLKISTGHPKPTYCNMALRYSMLRKSMQEIQNLC